MFSSYKPNFKATIQYLKQLKVKVNRATVNETLQNHPDWPTLLCISDSLNKWNIPNAAGKMYVNKIDELPTPFIAYINNRETPLAVITSMTDTTVWGYQKKYHKPVAEPKEDFLKKWKGVFLIAEQKENSGEPHYQTNRRKAFLNSLLPLAALALLIILSLLFINRVIGSINVGSAFSIAGIYLQYFVLLAGVFVTSLLLWYEIDKSNPLLQKVCTGIAKGNCNAILSGKQAKVFNGVICFYYFD